MESKNISFSVVLIGDDHNPSLLNPDFLIRNTIINEEWIVEDSRPFIISPVRTEFSFKNGVQFSLDPKRLIIKDYAPDGDMFPIPDILSKFVETLPHVKYRALGINFEKFYKFNSIEDAQSYQKNKFLKKGKWDKEGNLTEVSINFIYKFEDTICNISISPPSIISQGQSKDVGLILTGNFHRDFEKTKNHDQVVQLILNTVNNWEKDKERFKDISSKIIGE